MDITLRKITQTGFTVIASRPNGYVHYLLRDGLIVGCYSTSAAAQAEADRRNARIGPGS